MSHIFIFKPRLNRKVREGKCRTAISGDRIGIYQCIRNGKLEGVVDGKTYLFCAQHHPDAVANREEAWQVRYDAALKRDNDNYDRRRLENETMQLLANLGEAKIPKAVRDWVRKWKELVGHSSEEAP